jgi:hypothetical protein
MQMQSVKTSDNAAKTIVSRLLKDSYADKDIPFRPLSVGFSDTSNPVARPCPAQIGCKQLDFSHLQYMVWTRQNLASDML